MELSKFALDSIASGYCWECACGERFRTRENAVSCRKCRDYLLDFDNREDPVDLRTFLAQQVDEAKRAIETINETLGLQLARTVRGDEVKGVRQDEDGGTGKLYLDSGACRDIAEAFGCLANVLTK